MVIIGIGLVLVYSVLFYKNISKITELTRKYGLVELLMAVVISVFQYVIISIGIPDAFGYLINTFLLFVILLFLINDSFEKVLWITLNTIMHFMFSQIIISILYEEHLIGWLDARFTGTQLSSLYLIVVMIVMIIINSIYSIKGLNRRLSCLLNNRGMLKLLTVALAVIILYLEMLLILPYIPNAALGINNNIILYSCIVMLIVYYILMFITARTSIWQEEEVSSRIVRDIMGWQSYIDDLYVGVQDNVSQLEQIVIKREEELKKILINGDCNGAIRYLEEEMIDWDPKFIHGHIYSNYFVIEAVMVNLSIACKRDDINLEGTIFFPTREQYKERDVAELFYQISTNAYEACAKLDDDAEKTIRIKSVLEDGWLSITITNSYNGRVAFSGSEFITTKEYREYHGNGIRKIKKIVESWGGTAQIVANKEKLKFSMLLFIPYIDEEQKS